VLAVGARFVLRAKKSFVQACLIRQPAKNLQAVACTMMRHAVPPSPDLCLQNIVREVTTHTVSGKSEIGKWLLEFFSRKF
jgi:hypothetical protein